MKFGKLLKDLTDTHPQMSQQPLIRYKELKKHLKNIKKQQDAAAAAAAAGASDQQQQQQQQPPAAAGAQPQPQQQQPQQPADEQPAAGQPGQELPANLSAEEQLFIHMLNEDLLGFNRFFMDKEEEAVIQLQALADRIAGARAQQQQQQEGAVVDTQELKAALVDFHGEMVLLLHWSLLNYAAVVKILKKHDKQSGLLLRAPYLANVLQQPFSSTSIMSRLVKTAEQHIDSLVAQEATQDAAAAATAAAGGMAEGSSRQATPDAIAGQAAEAAAAAVAGGSAHEEAATATDAGQQQPLPPPQAAATALLADAAAQEATAAAAGAAAAAAGNGADSQTDTHTEELLAGTAVCARTRVALQTWAALCSNASTPSTVLPANSSQALVRALNVRQRWAKLTSMAPIMQQAGNFEASAQHAEEAAGHGADEQQHGGDSAWGQPEPAAAAAAVAQQQEAAADGSGHAGQKHKEEGQQEASRPAKRTRPDS